MTWLPMLDPRFRNIKLSGEVYYGENAVIDIPATSVDDRFKEITAGLSRAAAKHTTVAKRKCTTGVMGDGSDLGVSGGTGTVGSRQDAASQSTDYSSDV